MMSQTVVNMFEVGDVVRVKGQHDVFTVVAVPGEKRTDTPEGWVEIRRDGGFSYTMPIAAVERV